MVSKIDGCVADINKAKNIIITQYAAELKEHIRHSGVLDQAIP